MRLVYALRPFVINVFNICNSLLTHANLSMPSHSVFWNQLMLPHMDLRFQRVRIPGQSCLPEPAARTCEISSRLLQV